VGPPLTAAPDRYALFVTVEDVYFEE